MKLTKLLSGIEYISDKDISEVDMSTLVYDSRKAGLGSVFVCMEGGNTDGHLYATQAYEKGCRIFLISRDIFLPNDAFIIKTNDTRNALAIISTEFFNFPSRKLRIIGITGTKGKTTVATLIHDALTRAGYKTALVGTTGININGRNYPSVNSTPESYELQKAFAEMVECGVEYAVVEVSSQAYLTSRVHGIEFYLGIFTNLSPDHIGKYEHPDFENYMHCKSMLFAHSRYSLINMDDKYSNAMALASDGDVIYYSMTHPSDYSASDIRMCRVNDSPGVSFSCTLRDGAQRRIMVRTPGKYSVYNALAVIAACDILGIGIDSISETLEKTSVRGRFEIVNCMPDRTFVIDYAHNELGLKSVLEALRMYNPKRLVCLFGSVGGRSSLRREKMGKVASNNSDFCILTSDNPDKENPLDIISDIEKGFEGSNCPYKVIPDRREAINYAVINSLPGDVVIFAGKGHESYQLINGVKEPFSEREIIEESSALLTAFR